MEEAVREEQTMEQNRQLQAAVEAIVYVAEEPVTLDQIVAALEGADRDDVLRALAALQRDYQQAGRGIEVREVAGGYKMFTKAEHHETVRRFVKNLTPPLRLSMAALETLATIAYRQPVTLPEIQAIRGVHGAGVVKTLLERRLITTAGRKNVLGRPILYKTTRDFLIQFGLSGLQDLPSMEEFEELLKASFGEPLPAAQPVSAKAEVAGAQTPSSAPSSPDDTDGA
jgi:segregation and condensation protein B